MAWYKKLRLRRIARWVANGFFRSEAIKLTALQGRNSFTNRTFTVTIPVSRSYAKAMMRRRNAMYQQAQREGISRAEYERRVYDYYRSNGWINPDGSIDYWAEIREYQRRTDYHFRGIRPPYDPSQPHKKLSPNGGIDYSHTRRQARGYRQQSRASSRPAQTGRDEWIAQLRESARTARTPEQRQQFEQQIKNLGGNV